MGLASFWRSSRLPVEFNSFMPSNIQLRSFSAASDCLSDTGGATGRMASTGSVAPPGFQVSNGLNKSCLNSLYALSPGSGSLVEVAGGVVSAFFDSSCARIDAGPETSANANPDSTKPLTTLGGNELIV